MGMLGSSLGRGLAGAARGAGSLADKYIDEELAANRAKMLEELRRTSATNIRNDDFAFKTDPGNVGKMRDIRAGDIEAEGKATRGQRVAALNDSELVTAESTAAERAAADARRRYADETPGVVDRTRQSADATAKAAAKYREPREGVGGAGGMKLPAPVKARLDILENNEKTIRTAMTKAIADRNWEPDKDAGQKSLVDDLKAIQRQRDALLLPYTPQQGGADPWGLMGDPSKPAAPTAPAAPEAKPAAAPASPSLLDRAKSRLAAEAPAKPEAPAGSPQAKWDARQAEAVAQKAERSTQAQQSVQAARSQFDADAASLTPIDLLQKYGSFGSRKNLSLEQLAALKATEAKAR